MKTPPALYWVSKSLLSPQRPPWREPGGPPPGRGHSPQPRRPPQGVAVALPHPGIHGFLAHWQSRPGGVRADPRSVKDRQGGEQRALSWTWALNSGWPSSILAPLLRPHSGSEPSRCGGQTAGASQGACGLKSAALPRRWPHPGLFWEFELRARPCCFHP